MARSFFDGDIESRWASDADMQSWLAEFLGLSDPSMLTNIGEALRLFTDEGPGFDADGSPLVAEASSDVETASSPSSGFAGADNGEGLLVSDYSVPASDHGFGVGAGTGGASLAQGLFRADAGVSDAASVSVAAPAAAASPGAFAVDSVSFAKGGNGNGNGGGRGGNDDGDPNAISEYISGVGGGYNIKIEFKGSWTADLQDAFIMSADLLSSYIVGDVADVFYRGKTIDDIVITAELKDIDGEGGILGQAGPTAVRTDGYLPATAIMEFDSADAAAYDLAGQWEEIVLHEMIHSIGFGTIWGFLGLVDGSGTSTPTFTGTAATLTYQSEYGVTGATGVPLENNGVQGTAESHWDEETFTTLLMTGYLDATTQTSFDTTDDTDDLSNMTLASLEDIGYDTLWNPDDYLS